MADVLGRAATAQQIGTWLLIAFIVAYFIYKEWPEFRKRVSKDAVQESVDEHNGKTLNERLGSIESEVKQVNEKLDRDYKRINAMETKIEKTEHNQASTSEELGIIIEALLGALGGLQELGANGPTKDAEGKIHEYLNRKAHAGD